VEAAAAHADIRERARPITLRASPTISGDARQLPLHPVDERGAESRLVEQRTWSPGAPQVRSLREVDGTPGNVPKRSKDAAPRGAARRAADDPRGPGRGAREPFAKMPSGEPLPHGTHNPQ
jgi:hypothetical protein